MAQNNDRPQPRRRRYSEEEAREILNRAAGLDGGGTAFSEDHLLEMASELGISESQLVAAERAWLAEKERPPDERPLFIAERRRSFRRQLTQYAIVILFLFFINLTTSPDFFWVVFPALGWGMSLAFDASRTLETEGEQFERAYDKWQRKRRLRQERREKLAG